MTGARRTALFAALALAVTLVALHAESPTWALRRHGAGKPLPSAVLTAPQRCSRWSS